MQITTLFHSRAVPSEERRAAEAGRWSRTRLDTVYSVAVLAALAVMLLIGAVGATALVFEGVLHGSIRGQTTDPGAPGSVESRPRVSSRTRGP